MSPLMFKATAAAHIAIYKASRGRIIGRFRGEPLVLLTTVGRKSGQRRTTPLLAIDHEGALHLVASKGGATKHPLWYLNLVANPAVEINNRGRKFEAKAIVLEGEQREAAFDYAKKRNSMYAGYEKQTEGVREIPVIRLERI